jgi:hypothetical protein
MSNDFPSPDELRRDHKKWERLLSGSHRRTFSEWRQDRAERRRRQRRTVSERRQDRAERRRRREEDEREARETEAKLYRLALKEVDAHAESLRGAAYFRRDYAHRTRRELAPHVANVYRARGYAAKIQRAYDDSGYGQGTDGWITDNLPDISETDLVVWVTF